MKNRKILKLLVVLLLLQCPLFLSAQTSIVKRYGQLSIKGNYIMSEFGDTVQLRGMSLFWSQWMGKYYNAETVKWLKDDWNCTVIRAALGVENDGYLTNPKEEKRKIEEVVDAAIELGVYVIIDYHSHEAYKNPEAAKTFFSEMSKKYGKYPNVLYEIFNEPLQDVSWVNKLKPYSENVLKSIRENDPDNIVICGTRVWSQMASEAADAPIADKNVAYTLHFYAVSHGQSLRDEAEKALAKGIAIVVTEFGDCDYTGDGVLGYDQTNEWFAFMDKHKISWCNWSVSDKVETASILKPHKELTGWYDEDLTPSGLFIKKEIRTKNATVFKKVKKEKK